MSKKQEIERVEEALLSPLEQPLLQVVVKRLPPWITPDLLTGFGLFGNLIVFFAYILSVQNPGFLWIVNLGLVISWFGDSMDGTLARLRHRSTRHGFYFDHIVDSFSAVLICFGWGLSSYIRLDICLYILIAYLMMSIRSYMYAMAAGVFKIAYAGIGGTEIRVLLFLLNLIALYIVLPAFTIFEASFTLYDLIGILIVISLSFSFFIETIREIFELVNAERIK